MALKFVDVTVSVTIEVGEFWVMNHAGALKQPQYQEELRHALSLGPMERIKRVVVCPEDYLVA